MKDILKLAVRLIVITVIAGLLLGVTYNATKDPIALQQATKASEARKQVLPGAKDFEQIDLSTFFLPEEFAVIGEAYKGLSGGETAGITVDLTVNGYSPGLNITVGILTDGSIAGVKINAHAETPGLGAKANDEAYLSHFIGKSVPIDIVKTSPAKNNEVQAITGATITSKAVAGAVNLAVQFFNEYCKEGV